MNANQKEKTILTVTLINAGVNTLLAVLKIVIGWIGFSQALIADGIHSFSDLISDALVLFAARASMKNPDKDHPYGHQRIETLATIIIALILASVAGSIAYEAILRLIQHHSIIKPTIEVIFIAVISIIANEGLFHYSRKRGTEINSNLLISNAWHKRSDVFVSIIVLISVVGSMLGWQWLDAIGALIISAMIFQMAWKMIWQSAQELIDRGVNETVLEKIKTTINSIPGVGSIHQLRTRLHGTSIFIDLHIIVDPTISVSEGHHIGEEVHASLLKNIKNLMDVTVHIDPENDEIAHPSLKLPNREKLKTILEFQWKNLPGYHFIEKMTLHYLTGRLSIEIFIPQSSIGNTSAVELAEKYRVALSDLQNVDSVKIWVS